MTKKLPLGKTEHLEVDDATVMKDPVRVPLTTITGNGGEVVIREDGTPIAWTPSEEVKAGEHDGYTSIARFDVDEWRTHYKRPLPSSIDILDIGYWPDDESYEPPQEEFRLLADDARQIAGLKATLS